MLMNKLNWYMETSNSNVPVWRVFAAAAHRARQEGPKSDAEVLYKKALKLARSSLGEDNPEVAAIFVQLADFYAGEKDYKGAESAYRQAVAVYEKDEGQTTVLLAATLSRLAEVYEETGDRELAEASWGRVKIILAEQLKNLVEDGKDSS